MKLIHFGISSIPCFAGTTVHSMDPISPTLPAQFVSIYFCEAENKHNQFGLTSY